MIADSNGNQAENRHLSGGREARLRADPKTTNLNTVVSIPFQDSVLEDVILAEDSLAKEQSVEYVPIFVRLLDVASEEMGSDGVQSRGLTVTTHLLA